MNDVYISISIRTLRTLLDAFEERIASVHAQLESAQESRIPDAEAEALAIFENPNSMTTHLQSAQLERARAILGRPDLKGARDELDELDLFCIMGHCTPKEVVS